MPRLISVSSQLDRRSQVGGQDQEAFLPELSAIEVKDSS